MSSTSSAFWSFKFFEFDSGKYLIKDLSSSNQETLKKRLDLLQQEILNQKSKNSQIDLQIIIQGSESQVPNPPGFETPGSLANTRSKELENYIKVNYPVIRDNVSNFSIKPSIIGLESWNPPPGSTITQISELAGLEKYKKDQFVSISLLTYVPPPAKTPNVCTYTEFTPVRIKTDVEPENIKDPKRRPTPFLTYQQEYSIGEELKDGGLFTITFNPYYYPDALKVEIINKDRAITQTGFIPLFVIDLNGAPGESDGFFRRSVLQPFLNKYPLFPTSEIWNYLPKIPKNNISAWEQNYPTNTPNMFKVDIPESEKPKQFPNPLYRPFNQSSIFGKNYKNIEYPAFNYGIKNDFFNPNNNLVVSPDITEENSKYYKSLTFELNADEKFVKIYTYGFVKDTVLDFKAKCEAKN
jgi:hypothetical protein